MIYFLVLFLILIPLRVLGSVVINEIAWMGTLPKVGETAQAAANNEWIELYNQSSSPVNLDGWVFMISNASSSILLKGSIEQNSYFLLERGSDTVLPDIKADLVYPFKNNSLSNSGETLILKDENGTEQDRVNGADNWKIGGNIQTGNNETKETAQRINNGWITATATPRAQSFGFELSTNHEKIQSGQSSQGASGDNSSSGGYYSSQQGQSVRVFAGNDRAEIAGSLIEFIGEAYGLKNEPLENARFWWNFGDGEQAEGRVVSHIFQVPGNYTVGLHVSSGMYASSDYANTQILPNQIAFSGVLEGEEGYIKLSNPSSIDIDIGEWVVSDSSGKKFVIPSKTKVGAKSEIALSNKTTGLLKYGGVFPLILLYPNLTKAANFSPQIPTSVVVNSNTESRVSSTTPVPNVIAMGDERINRDNKKEELIQEATSSLLAKVDTPFNPGALLFTVVALGFGIFCSVGFLILRKFFYR